MDIAQTMKSRRKVLGISQQDLSEMAAVSLATIKDIERGQGNPSLSTVQKILDVLGMEMIFQVKKMV
ncbi:MAG: helix-turn-helix domain-containing protein [Prevotella sp.]|jgi:predicted transcriptional regulator|nr:helix-turn-helix domain-containing protein [Prevotella sp.]